LDVTVVTFSVNSSLRWAGCRRVLVWKWD